MGDNLLGWRLDLGTPFEESFFIANNGLSKVFIGPNGFGKTKLLESLAQTSTVRVYRSLPDSLRHGTIEQVGLVSGPNSVDGIDAAEFVSRIDSDDGCFWAVRRSGDTVLVSLSGADGLELPAGSWRLPAPPDDPWAETWIRPEAELRMDLGVVTKSGFTNWLQECLPCLDAPLVLSTNPLVGRLPNGAGISLLDLAEAFSRELASRASTRVAALVGFDLAMRIHPEEDFSWELRLSGGWFSYSKASTAIRRWVGLAARETLREFALVSSGVSQFHESRFSRELFTSGTIPGDLVPGGPVRSLGTRSAWVMLDEPEVHLFGSEAQRLGRSLAEISSSGRLAVVTHSLELAAGLLGMCEFFTFTEPGKFEYSPPDEWSNVQLARLASDGPGALSGVKVLYVEGYWDARLLEHFYRDRLRDSRVLICPTHGTLAASGVVTSVWQRLIGSPFGLMFDALTAEQTERDWARLQKRAASDRRGTVRDLRSRAGRIKGLSNEDIGLLRVQANVLEAGMESRLRFVMHGLSDIFQVVSPRAFGATSDSWRQLGLAPRESLKAFVRTRFGQDLEQGDVAHAIFSRLESGEVGVDEYSFAQLDGAVSGFLSWSANG